MSKISYIENKKQNLSRACYSGNSYYIPNFRLFNFGNPCNDSLFRTPNKFELRSKISKLDKWCTASGTCVKKLWLRPRDWRPVQFFKELLCKVCNRFLSKFKTLSNDSPVKKNQGIILLYVEFFFKYKIFYINFSLHLHTC